MTRRIFQRVKKVAGIALLAALAVPLAAAPAVAADTAAANAGAAQGIDAPQPTAVLNDQVVVENRVVRLGDLFTNVPSDKAQVPVAYAPEPGQQAVFDARWLYRVAQYYGLDWRPLSVKDQAVVVRDSVTIGRAEIEQRLRQAMVKNGLDPSTQVELSNRMMTLHLPASGSGRIGIENLYRDQQSGHFTAIVVAPAGDPQAERVRVTGRVYRTVEVPVLARRMLPGDVIQKDDLDWIKVRAESLQNDTIVDAADIVGKTPTRGLASDQPMRTRDIRNPLLVKRGQLVTIYHQMPRMTLTVQGKALEDGSKGEVVRVQNTRSNTVIDGVVEGSGRVVVKLPRQLAMNPDNGG